MYNIYIYINLYSEEGIFFGITRELFLNPENSNESTITSCLIYFRKET